MNNPGILVMEIPTVLILSANDAHSQFMQACLSAAGYHTWISSQGEMTISDPVQGSPSLIIFDWRLLKAKGMQFLHQIREQETDGHVPILVMGAEMVEEDVLASLEAGADICLTESLHPKVLVARVRSFLRRQNP